MINKTPVIMSEAVVVGEELGEDLGVHLRKRLQDEAAEKN